MLRDEPGTFRFRWTWSARWIAPSRWVQSLPALLVACALGCNSLLPDREEEFVDETLHKLSVTADQEGPSTGYLRALLQKRMEYRERSVVSADGNRVTKFLPVKQGKGAILKQIVTDNLQSNPLAQGEDVQVTSYDRYDWFYEYPQVAEQGTETTPNQTVTMDLLQIAGTPVAVSYVEKVIEEAEYRPQVLLDVAVLQTTWKDGVDLGAKWSYLSPDRNIVKQFALDQSLTSDPSESFAGAAGLTLSAIHNSPYGIQAVIEALATRQDVEVLSRPTLLMVSGFRAEIVTGQKVPVPTYTPQAGSTPVVQIQFESVGVHLHVLPIVTRDRIRLDIQPEVSDLIGTVMTGGIPQPVIAHSYASATVEVKSGQTLVLGGLYVRNLRKALSGLPGMMDVPALKYLYSRAGEDKDYSNLVFLLTPRIVYTLDEETAAAASPEEGEAVPGGETGPSRSDMTPDDDAPPTPK